MKPVDYEIAQELKARIAQVAELIDFRVYGSKARGDDDEFSDMDVFVEVLTMDKRIKEDIADISWEVGLKNLLVISPLVFSKDEIENTPLRVSPIVKNIYDQGISI
jgi:predicted nucleotidyltransferase